MGNPEMDRVVEGLRFRCQEYLLVAGLGKNAVDTPEGLHINADQGCMHISATTVEGFTDHVFSGRPGEGSEIVRLHDNGGWETGLVVDPGAVVVHLSSKLPSVA